MATVASVIDGDTIGLQGGERVRLILVDTPELAGDCYAQEAAEFTRAMLPPGTQIRMEKDTSERDRYGRLLRYVYLPDGRQLNALLLRNGYAKLAIFEPDTRHLELLRINEEEARAEGTGLWSACTGRRPAPAVSGPDRDCADFATRQEAQAFFEVAGAGDPHRLDGDGDGLACESLP